MARQRAGVIGSWLRRSSERGWAALARFFPAQRRGSDAPPLDILPPPVAPPLHTPPAPALEIAQPQVLAFVDQRLEVEHQPAAGAIATLTRPTAAAEAVQPLVVQFPTRVRLKAGMGLVLYIAIAGAAIAVVVLMVAGLVARAAGQI